MKNFAITVKSANAQTASTPSRTMMRLLSVASVALFGLFAVSSASASCTGKSSLAGTYGVSAAGTTRTGVGKFLSGTLTFDSACNATGVLTIGENSTYNVFANVTGSYVTNSDNTLTLSLALPGASSAETYNLGFSPVFGEALGMETDGSANASMDLKPQFFPASVRATPYSNATLKGTWAGSCITTVGSQSDVSYLTFDGTVWGGVSGIVNDITGSFTPLTVAGFYGVHSDGSFGVGLYLTPQSSVGLAGSIDNNGNELQFVVIQGPTVIESCVAKRVS